MVICQRAVFARFEPGRLRLSNLTGVCKICRHEHCARIELESAAGRSDRTVAAEFGVSRDSVQRHWKNHVTAARKAELIGGPVAIAKLAQRAAEEDRSLIDYFSILRSELLRLFMDARQRGLTYDAASIAQRLLNTLEAIGRLTGQLRQAGVTINNVNSVSAGQAVVQVSMTDPTIARLEHGLLKALAPFPDAKAAVVKMLATLDADTGRPLPNGHAALPPQQIEGTIGNG